MVSSLTDPKSWRESLAAELAAIVAHGEPDAARVSAAKLLAELMAQSERASQSASDDRLDELGTKRAKRLAS